MKLLGMSEKERRAHNKSSEESMGGVVNTILVRSVCSQKEIEMAPAFKGCLEHAHRGVAWLRRKQMMELTHAHKGSHSCVRRR